MNEKMKNKFIFKGKEICFLDTLDWEVVKSYTESSHFDRKLVRDSDGALYLYEFYEYNDFIYTTYALVKNEEDADKLNNERFINVPEISFRFMPNYDVVLF